MRLYLHKGSEVQLLGNPIAVGSTCGYEINRDFKLFLKSSPYPIESNQYAIQHETAATASSNLLLGLNICVTLSTSIGRRY